MSDEIRSDTAELYNDVYEKQPLIREHNIIIAPTEIDPESYRELLVAMFIARRTHPAKPIYLFLNGYGGETDLALALVTHIKRDNLIYGVVTGGCHSAHTMLFSACKKRYISEYSIFGFHGISQYLYEERITQASYKRNAESFAKYDKTVASLLASACANRNYDYDYWIQTFSDVETDTLTVDGKDAISEYGLGEMLPESLPIPIL